MLRTYYMLVCCLLFFSTACWLVTRNFPPELLAYDIAFATIFTCIYSIIGFAAFLPNMLHAVSKKRWTMYAALCINFAAVASTVVVYLFFALVVFRGYHLLNVLLSIPLLFCLAVLIPLIRLSVKIYRMGVAQRLSSLQSPLLNEYSASTSAPRRRVPGRDLPPL